MRNVKSLILGLSLAGSLLGGGVAAADEYGGRSYQDRVEVRDHRIERNDRVVVDLPRRAPPPIPVEHVVRRRGYDWMPGEYQFNAGQYQFVPGHYFARQHGYRWVPARWVREGRTFVKIPGHWARA